MVKIELNLARNCFRYLVKLYNIKEVYLPYYICPTVRQALQKEDCKLKFYHIDENFYPTQKFNPEDFIIYPNYFGICSKNVMNLSKTYKNLIVDNAQGYFMQKVGLASVYSLRKFFEVSDGAYLLCEKDLGMIFDKDKYVPENEITTYEDFVRNELRLNDEDIKLISDYTKDKMQNINLEEARAKRLENFSYWHSRFKDLNLLKINLSDADVPFVYPYMSRDGILPDELKSMNIIRYWSPLPKEFLEYRFYKYLIPIPLNNK